MHRRLPCLWSVLTTAVAALLSVILATSAPGLDFPGPAPGPARGRIEGGRLTLENDVLSIGWVVAQDRLRPERISDRLSGGDFPCGAAECFRIILAGSPSPNPRPLKASDLKVVGQPRLDDLQPSDRLPRLAEHSRGRQITVELAAPDGSLAVQWRAVLRDGSNYVRQTVTLKAGRQPLEVGDVVLVELEAPGAVVAANVDGAPVVAGNMFFACEHPIARSEVAGSAPSDGNRKPLRCIYPANALLRPGEPRSYSAVIGVVPEGQIRRGFLYYLERERAHPYRPLLHYNNGSEIGCEYWRRRLKDKPEAAAEFRRTQEQTWLANIRAFGQELVSKRGVVMDSFAHDFEWDDETLAWQFHGGYPHGFTPAQQAARECGARVGVWLSPSGGYPCKAARLEYGRKHGFELNANGLSLAGPRYYARFRTVCANMIREYGVNYFKFDGFGAGNSQPGAGPYASDVEALLRLMDELRALAPDVFLNPSTGTWPSPFWLVWSDSIWRQGSDTSVLGKGSDRQKWITYRDSEIYHGVLEKCPLYPISSLMIHGIYVNALPLFANPYDPASPRPTYDPADVVAEIRSFFGTGTNLQEMYIAPPLMTPQTWDALAEAARWSRANADVLADTHWVGGDPAKGQVYGWASWSSRRGILTIRNPDDRPAQLALDLGRAFELPGQAARRYLLKSPWKEDSAKPGIELSAGQPHTFILKPFEVLVLEAQPVPQR
jgi:hypothetical protein